MGQLHCGRVRLRGTCGVRELRCEVVVLWGRCIVGSCGVEELWCGVFVMWGSYSVWELQCGEEAT